MIEKRHFIGMDQDTTDKLLAAGSYRYALNCHASTSDGANVGAVENIKGNTLVQFTLPPGNNRCIGTYEDRVGDSIIFLVANSANEDCILQFFINDLKIVGLMKSSLFQFDANSSITGMALEGDLFYWTEGLNPQRKINVYKARTEKKLVCHLYFKYDPSPLTAYTLLIRDNNGITIENSTVYTVPGPSNATLKEQTTQITNGINSLGQSPSIFEATNKGTYVELQFNTPGYYVVNFFASAGGNAMAVYENMYPMPVRESFFDLLKYPPNFPPLLFKENNPSFKDINEADKKFFEFRLRYNYDDNERSVLGPVSKLPGGEFPFNGSKDEFYKVFYKDNRNSDPYELSIIKSVELIFRQGNTGIWKTIKTIERGEMIGNDWTYFFLNNEHYAAIAADEGDKPFDSLPLLSNSLAIMNNYLILDSKLEGYDPVIPDVLMTLKINNEVPFLSTNDRGSFLKRPGFYKYSIVYFDRGNRTATVSTDQSMHLSIPGYAEDLNNLDYVEAGSPGKRYGTVEVNWRVRHLPPVWATHWCWARTLDSLSNNFLTSRLTGARYLKANKTEQVSFGASNARYIEISFGHWADFNDNNPDANHGWSFNEGDRVRFLKVDENTWHTTIVSAEVIEKISSSQFLVSNDSSLPQVANGTIAQLYSPKRTVENDLYFETGDYYEIGNLHLPNRYHKGQFFDQNPNDPLLTPAEGTMTEGDNYRIVGREWATNIDLVIDSPRADQRYRDSLDSYNMGKVHIHAPNIGQAKRGHTYRNSKKRFVGTNINGYSSFDSLDATDLQKNYGDAQRLERIDNILLALHTREAISLYIEENIYTDVAGNPTVTISDKIIGNDRVLKGQFGTDNPESLVVHGSRGYWFCTSKGQYVRYGGDGLTPISKYGFTRYFKDKGDKLRGGVGKVHGTYDPSHEKLIVSFSQIITKGDQSNLLSNAETLAFDEDTNRWTTFYSIHPEQMQKVNDDFVTFKDGALWLENSNPLHNNFYGIQYTSQMEVIFNQNPSSVKVYQSTSVEATDLWLPVEIRTPEGQLSSLQVSDFELLEGVFYAAILRDVNTPNVPNPITQGDVIRSVIATITLENSNTDKSVLYFLNLDSTASFLTNTY